jgi:hypothetical protein
MRSNPILLFAAAGLCSVPGVTSAGIGHFDIIAYIEAVGSIAALSGDGFDASGGDAVAVVVVRPPPPPGPPGPSAVQVADPSYGFGTVPSPLGVTTAVLSNPSRFPEAVVNGVNGLDKSPERRSVMQEFLCWTRTVTSPLWVLLSRMERSTLPSLPWL